MIIYWLLTRYMLGVFCSEVIGDSPPPASVGFSLTGSGLLSQWAQHTIEVAWSTNPHVWDTQFYKDQNEDKNYYSIRWKELQTMRVGSSWSKQSMFYSPQCWLPSMDQRESSVGHLESDFFFLTKLSLVAVSVFSQSQTRWLWQKCLRLLHFLSSWDPLQPFYSYLLLPTGSCATLLSDFFFLHF